MTAWTRFDEREPTPGTVILVRSSEAALPRVAKPAGRGGGWHVSFVPFEGGEHGMRGHYHEEAELGDWLWALIPE